MNRRFLVFISSMFLLTCKPTTDSTNQSAEVIKIESKAESIAQDTLLTPEGWFEITTENTGIILDIKYATPENFTKKVIYECARCYLRPELARKILDFHQELVKSKMLGLKLFDCYRPQPAQQKLWDIVPNPIYVTPPDKGSMHNRGLAVDLTLVDREGRELDMGTSYDYFGEKAHIDFYDHPATVLENRKILQEGLLARGLQTIQSEWWHFSLADPIYPLDKWEWDCPD